MSLIAELQRRNVIRVAILYVVGSWLILQVGDLLFDLMGLPDFALRIVLGILLLGFPVALAFSWIYELTPEGLKRDAGTSSPQSAATAGKLNVAVIATILLALSVLLLDRFGIIGKRPAEATDPTATVAEAPPAATGEPAAVPEDDASIAVLPFLNLSTDAEQEFFSDGLADTLLHRLAQVPDLRVAARTSSFQFKGQNEDVREIARQLGVATILEGSVQRQGNRVRITAQLIDGSDGSHLWSEVFDDTLDDIFRVQDEIARAVADALTSTLLPADDGSGDTQNVAAYEAYLRGIDALEEGTPEGTTEALAQFELAVELDPEFALAWAAMTRAHQASAQVGTVPWENTGAPALAAATRAVEIAPDRVEALLALALALDINDEEDRRVEIVERAYEINPNDARAIRAMANLEARSGQPRAAFRLTQRAVTLDPLDVGLRMQLARTRMLIGDTDDAIREMSDLAAEYPDHLDVQLRYGGELFALARMPEGIAHLLGAIERRPDFLRGHLFLANAFVEIGDPDRARHHLERAETISPDRAIDDRAEFCYDSGDLDCFREAQARYIEFQQAAERAQTVVFEQGKQHAYLGELEPAIEALTQLVELDGEIDTDWFRASLWLAWAYGEAGQEERRDRILDAVEADISADSSAVTSQEALDPNWFTVDVLRGKLDSAIERLDRMSGNRYFMPSLRLENRIFYRSLHGHPGYAAVLEKQKQRESDWRTVLAELESE